LRRYPLSCFGVFNSGNEDGLATRRSKVELPEA